MAPAVTIRGFKMAVTRIAMWSGPRNISTALMRAFENRTDCAVVDEPLYGYYLKTTGSDHPVADKIIAAMDCDWRSVTKGLLESTPQPCEVYYQKHMTQHILPEMDLAFVDKLENCFLIREPRRIIASYARVRPEFTLEELGIPQQWEIFQRIADLRGVAPPVIDSAQTLKHPEASLRALCARLKIDFSKRMLHWPAGSRRSDGVWASHWYAAVEKSTGFTASTEIPLAEVQIPPKYEAICNRAQVIYSKLLQFALIKA